MGKPTIIIPKAYTAENHQEYNAKSIEKQGAGITILEKNLTPETLNKEVFKLLGDRDALLEMTGRSKSIGKPEAIDLIYNEIIKIYNENNKQKKSSKNSKKTNVQLESDEEVKVDSNDNIETKEETKIIGIKKK